MRLRTVEVFLQGVMRNVSFADYPVITAFSDRVMAEATDVAKAQMAQVRALSIAG